MAQAAAGAADGGGYSSSVDLSSPPSEIEHGGGLPHSPTHSSLFPSPHSQQGSASDANSTIRVAPYPPTALFNRDAASSRYSGASHQPSRLGTSIPATAPPGGKTRKPRKKKDAEVEKKEKPARKPRGSSAAATASTISRRSLKGEASTTARTAETSGSPGVSGVSGRSTAPSQSTITVHVPAPVPVPDSVGVTQHPHSHTHSRPQSLPAGPNFPDRPPSQPAHAAHPLASAPTPAPAPASPRTSRNGLSMPNEAMRSPPPVYAQNPMSQPATTASTAPASMSTASTAPTFSPRQRTSGLNYDPIRSLTIPSPSSSSQPFHTPPRPTPPNPALPPASASHSGNIFRPSASPSISSMIDPSAPITMSAASPKAAQNISLTSPVHSHFALPEHSSTTIDLSSEPSPKPAIASPKQSAPSAMDLDPTPIATGLKPAELVKKTSSGPPSNAAPSPKPVRAKEQPPPAPQGSGLLSSALFGGEAASTSDSATNKVPNIVIHIDLKGQHNQVINFARMAEDKYGFAALYPRLAAQKERLARVAAAGAALEKSANGKLSGLSATESGDDDMSVDIDRDSDNDGDVAMSGVNGGPGTGANSETDGKGTKKRRRRKMEDYDVDDAFIDDSELAWESQAAVSKEGFFVYCGPLVPEGEKAAVERGDPPKRGRGRGRGGGPGSRGGRGGGGAAGLTSESGRGGGSGLRGSGTTRKPRVTKAGRALLEREKQDREKMAPLAAKPVGYPS